MAAKFYGVNLGEDNLGSTVATGTSTTSKQYEFAIANTTLTGTNKAHALLAIEAIRNAIMKDTDPGA